MRVQNDGKPLYEPEEVRKLKELKRGDIYYIFEKTSGSGKKIKNRATFAGFCGVNECMLMFVKLPKSGKRINECYGVVDFIQNRIKILSSEQYFNEKSKKLWDNIEKAVKA